MNALGNKIRSLRQQKGWKQEDMAELINISIPALSKIETGITDINLSRLEQVADILEISTIQMLTYDDAVKDEIHRIKIEDIDKKIMACETKVIDLQNKIIKLLEELYHKQQLLKK